MKDTLKNFFGLIKKNLPVLLIFEFIFKISTVLVFVPLIIKTLNLIIDNQGIMFITGKNISEFMTNPFVVAGFLSVLFIFLCVSIFEMNCILACLEYSSQKQRMNVTGMFLSGYSRMKKVASESVWKTLLIMLMTVPMFNIHTAVVLCEKVDILGTVLRYIFLGISFKNSVIILSAITVFLGAFAITATLKNDDRGHILKRFTVYAGYVILTGTFIAVILLVIYYVLSLIAALILRYFGNPQLSFVRLVRFESIIYYFIAFVAGSAGVVFNTAMIYVLSGKKEPEYDYRVAIKEKNKNNKSFLKKIFVSLLVVIIGTFDAVTILGYATNGSHLLEDFFISTTVTAHRGGAKFAPENTIDAVKYAIESGADYIEIDVQLTADKEVILLHDENLKRTTGYNGYAYKMKYDDIARLNAGGNFDGLYTNSYIPKLSEVLELCKGKINLNIELKKTGKIGNELVDKVIELIYLNDMQEQCVITSTNYSYLGYIKNTAPEIRTGFIANTLFGDPSALEDADFFSVKYILVTENFVKTAHNAGKEVHVWTVNSKHLINRMKGLDVDSIITDDPILCRKILSRKNDRKSFLEILQTILYR